MVLRFEARETERNHSFEGFANFNVAFLLALPALALLPLVVSGRARVRALTLLLPLYTWLGFMTPQPHKEERFLFVVYPFLCLAAAVSASAVASALQYVLGKASKGLGSAAAKAFLAALAVVFVVLSASRIANLQARRWSPAAAR